MEAEEKGSAGFDKTGTLVVATNEQVEATIKTGSRLQKQPATTASTSLTKTASKRSFRIFPQRTSWEQDTHRMTDILTEP